MRGALNNGITPAELQEVMLHVAIYCGIPASLEGFRVAREVVEEFESAKGKTKKLASARRRRRAKR